MLEDSQVNPADNNNESIKIASLNGHLPIVNLLLSDSRGKRSPAASAADPTVNNNYPIKIASRNGYWKIVQRLLQDSKVNPSVNNNYPIKWVSSLKIANLGNLWLLRLVIMEEKIYSQYYTQAEIETYGVIAVGIKLKH